MHCPSQVNSDGIFKYAGSPWFSQSLYLLASSGAYGVAVDVWVSRSRPSRLACVLVRLASLHEPHYLARDLLMLPLSLPS